jgi:ferric-dicitrate binding protein FerR (iron transport regulator)
MPTPKIDKAFLVRLLNGKATKLEEEQFLNWLDCLEEDEESIWLKECWKNCESDSNRILGSEDRVLSNVLETIATPNRSSTSFTREIHMPRRTIWDLYPILRYASIIFAILLPLLIISYFSSTQNDLDQVVQLEKNTHNGQHLTFMLSDGTKVTLNANSKLTYPKTFTDSARIVYLKGEAFFDVAKDARRPFSVRSRSITTIALGTSFNINADPNGSYISVALVSGAAKVTFNNEAAFDHSEIINPGQQLTFSEADNEYIISDFDIEKITGWKDGKIIFEQASFEEVKSTLEEWYDVEILVKDRNGDLFTSSWHYSGRFQNKSLEFVMDGIAFVKGFKYELAEENKKVIVN